MLELVDKYMGMDARMWFEDYLAEADSQTADVAAMETYYEKRIEHYHQVIRELRAHAEKLAGLIREKKKEGSGSGLSSVILFVFANLILAGVIVYTNLGHRSKLDFLVIALFFLSLLVLLAGKDRCPDRLRPLVRRLSSFTYFIYLFQMPVIELILFLRR
jgi:hypothetical protein